MQSGYFKYPSIHGNQVVFTCEDDLWMVQTSGEERAWRLTASDAENLYPVFSPDGGRIAFVSYEEGPPEVYVLPAQGGPAQRLTFQAAGCKVLTWSPQGDIIYTSSADAPFSGERWLFAVSPEGGLPRRLPLGPVSAVAYGPKGAIVLGRNTKDPARWKRYRGGTAGELWIDRRGDGHFVRLATPANGNVANPCWVKQRIYFLSDHEGVCNVYSFKPDGSDLRRHTDHDDFYARNLTSDGKRMVYHCGADLYLLDPARDLPVKLEVNLGSSQAQSKRRFVNGHDFLQSVDLSPDGSRLAVTSRGKAFMFANWEGPVVQYGEPEGVRYRLLGWIDESTLMSVASDEGEEEYLVVFSADNQEPPRRLELDMGLVHLWWCNPRNRWVALANHRNELLMVNLEDPELKLHKVDSSKFGQISGVCWSHDGRWLAYDYADTSRTRAIKLMRLEDLQVFYASRPVQRDFSPSFDPDGRYLYFVGQRELEPHYDDAEFGLGFPKARRLFAIALRKDVPSPFVQKAKPLESAAVQAKRKAEAELSHDVVPTEIDLDGLTERITAFPLGPARYSQIRGVKGDKVLFLEGDSDGHHRGTIEIFDFEKQEQERLVNKWVEGFWMANDTRTLVYWHERRLRVLPAEHYTGHGTGCNRPTGHIDLERVRVSVRPTKEFRQMFREAWRLQRDHFWSEDMSGLDWRAIYARYQPLVDRVTTRSEFSDLLWELLGELGTSHAYEMGGDYRRRSHYYQGFLGADWELADGHYRCRRVVRGDGWNTDATSPLLQPGVGVEEGDVLLAINGQPLEPHVPPGALLVNQAAQEVQLTVSRGGEVRTVAVRALSDETAARYREWVSSNRALVHELTGGRVGYLHVPDMGTHGYAEFHRGYLAECDREALVVDVRFNAGGHVSALLLQKLARRRIGYSFPRWGTPEPYPSESPRGPLVAVTNEHAGSDGDIFSHAFKLMKLGPLIGKRTWGGVIGISPRHYLADDTVTTQPEFSFFFDDVGWKLENRGTEPDIEVSNAPQDYVAERDPQLLKAIEVALAKLAELPAHTPSPTLRPNVAPPVLPPRAKGKVKRKKG